MAIKDDMQDVQEAVINELITENGITNTLADDQVTEDKILNSAVTTNKIATGAVTAAQLGSDVDLTVADGSITTAKLATGAVSASKIGVGEVGTIALADDAVTPAKLDRAYLESTGGSVSGELLVGTTANKGQLTVGDGATGTKTIALNGSASSTSVMNLDFLGGGSGNPSGRIGYSSSTEAMTFHTGDLASISEAARIINSGSLLVGKTEDGFSNAGHAFFGGGDVYHIKDGNAALYAKRLSSDGEIIKLYKDTSLVGSIGTNGGDLMIGTGDTGMRFSDGEDCFVPSTITGNANRDNAIDLGKTSSRFDDIYATNGTIQTSDQNDKQDIEELTDAEQRVAVAAKGLLRKFRWKDKVAEKGDEARTHFGIIAQDLQAAFAAEGLDAAKYAMFISTTWTDEDTGEERTRMGVRYSELLAFIIAAI